MKVGIYARVSTKDRQEVQNQLRQLREFAALQGWTGPYIPRPEGRGITARPEKSCRRRGDGWPALSRAERLSNSLRLRPPALGSR